MNAIPLPPANALKVGDAVCWKEMPDDEGEVIHVTDTAVSVKWHEDGLIGVYRLDGKSIHYLVKKGE